MIESFFVAGASSLRCYCVADSGLHQFSGRFASGLARRHYDGVGTTAQLTATGVYGHGSHPSTTQDLTDSGGLDNDLQ